MGDSRSEWFDRTAIKSRLIAVLEPAVQAQGAELVDIELKGLVQNQTLRVLVHKESGLGVGHCRDISIAVGDILDVEDPLPGRYRLEVTSPGLSRPLSSDRDFGRALERNLKVVTASGHTIFGCLLQFDDQLIIVAGESGRHEIPRAGIAKATIEAEL